MLTTRSKRPMWSLFAAKSWRLVSIACIRSAKGLEAKLFRACVILGVSMSIAVTVACGLNWAANSATTPHPVPMSSICLARLRGMSDERRTASVPTFIDERLWSSENCLNENSMSAFTKKSCPLVANNSHICRCQYS